MKKTITIFLLISIIPFQIACSGDENSEADFKRIKVQPRPFIVKGETGSSANDFVAHGLECDHEGNVYVLDQTKKILLKYEKTGKLEKIFNLNSTINKKGKRYPLLSQFNIDRNGRIIFLDSQNGKISVFSDKMHLLFDIDLGFRANSFSVDGGGRIYVSGYKTDNLNNAVYLYDPDGKFIKSFGRNVADINRAGNPLMNRAIVLNDPDGNLYQLFQHFMIRRKYSPEGELTADKTVTEEIDNEMFLKKIPEVGEADIDPAIKKLFYYGFVKDAEICGSKIYFSSSRGNKAIYVMDTDCDYIGLYQIASDDVFAMQEIGVNPVSKEIYVVKPYSKGHTVTSTDIYSIPMDKDL